MSFDIEWDAADRSRFESDLEAAASEVEQGFPETMLKIGEIFAASIDEQFMSGGIPKYVPLAWMTIEGRKEWEKETGRKVVAGYTTPLRRSDETRLASIATVPGVAGSAFKSDARMVQVGPDESVLDYVHDLNDGNVEKHIPPREFVVLSEKHEQEAIDTAQAAIDDFGARFSS